MLQQTTQLRSVSHRKTYEVFGVGSNTTDYLYQFDSQLARRRLPKMFSQCFDRVIDVNTELGMKGCSRTEAGANKYTHQSRSKILFETLLRSSDTTYYNTCDANIWNTFLILFI